MRYFLRHIVTMPTPIALLLLVCALGMWTVDYVRIPEQWGLVLCTQMLTLTNAVMLSTLFYRAKASGHFSLVPALLYVLTIAIFPNLRVHYMPQIIVIQLLSYLLLTRDMSESNELNGTLFFVSLLLCITALFSPDAMWCIVFLWVVAWVQGCFSLRTILASLLAAGLFAIYYALMVYMGWSEQHDWSVLVVREWFAYNSATLTVVSVSVLYAAFLYMSGAAFRRSSYDLVSARLLLYHVVMLGLVSAPLVLFVAATQDALVLLPLALAATTGVYLLQKESESRGITLLVYLAAAITLYILFLSSL